MLTRTAIINKIKPINFRPTVKQSPTKFYKKMSKSSIILTVATCDQERVDSAQPRSNQGHPTTIFARISVRKTI